MKNVFLNLWVFLYYEKFINIYLILFVKFYGIFMGIMFILVFL